jgi:hypothetical protein
VYGVDDALPPVLHHVAAGAEHGQAAETRHRRRDEHRAYRCLPGGAEEEKHNNASDEDQADKPHLRLRTKGCARQPERRVTEPHSHDTPFTSWARQLPPLA